MPHAAPTYWLTRFMILRLLGIVYAVAFLVAINQLVPLIGSNGLLPIGNYFKQVGDALGSNGAGFVRLPSVFWLWHSDTALLTVAWTGFAISLVAIAGYTNAPLMGLLWFLYMSIVHAGQDWYGYGWEIQLTETGFLAIFLCPLLDMRPFPRRAPPFIVIVLFRWLILRIMLGSGLIKFRGDKVWRNGTALYYHFETQPIPGPLSRWFHFMPRIMLKMGVWFNWLAELVAPWFIFWPRIGRHIAGVIIMLLQVVLIFSGNLSFLNWLTIVPALACFDDGFWSLILPRQLVRKAAVVAESAEESIPMLTTSWVVAVVIALLSIEPVANLLSPGQVMNTSFDPLDLVNTYGAFGSVGQQRLNVVFEGTADDTTGNKANWKPYVYKFLPVLLNKRPPQIAPYQPHLDWQMWFAAMSTSDQYPWTYNLAWKLLHNDPGAIGLFASNPFPGKPPRCIRAVLYRYKFARPGNPQGLYWEREQLGEWLPILSANNTQLIKYLRYQGWIK
ncbi:lipase maturation factor family protein [Mucilaginibacter ginsenosidivorans]|uniref:Lipase maturation factor family protein n=1 Tax=Mucilaginibacter ginsenosidivorans TaxID=398053 RepID=A0A5B8USF2_9SPHI|nr:lipase maturation factor family protein [Mucilaginibacter ginsenosidivorans]QEC61842.1 lipase maturation factor family protein [Mucilaginibacter ginsenosidivorans]